MEASKLNVWTCVASGPSLRKEDIEYAARHSNIAVCGLSFRLAPMAKLLHSADHRWWRQYHQEAKETCKSAIYYSASTTACREFDLTKLHIEHGEGFHKQKDRAYTQGLSGGQLIQLAYQHGAEKVILLGYDMQHTDGKAHWHKDYKDSRTKEPWPNVPNIGRHIKKFNKLAEDSPIEIINCTRQTALTCFKRMTIEEALP